MPTLERSNPLPLYYQLKEVLKQQIRDGHLAPHTTIPSEPELVIRYQVSRATVRQALAELIHEGLLYRQRGKGTFVNEPRVQQTRGELISFSETIRRQGKLPGGQLLASELVRGTETIRQQLRLVDTDQLIRVERVRTADAIPVAYEIDYLPYARAARLYERAGEIADGSLYSLMSTEGLVPSIAEQTLKADHPSVREAELLRIEPSESGIRLTCVTFDPIGLPILYTESFYPGTRYEIHLTMRISK